MCVLGIEPGASEEQPVLLSTEPSPPPVGAVFALLGSLFLHVGFTCRVLPKFILILGLFPASHPPPSLCLIPPDSKTQISFPISKTIETYGGSGAPSPSRCPHTSQFLLHAERPIPDSKGYRPSGLDGETPAVARRPRTVPCAPARVRT